jgi:hypothetical protein
MRDLGVVAGVEERGKLLTVLAVLFAVVRAPLGKWDVFNRAMDDTGRAIRLVAILVASALPPAAIAALTYFLVRR